MSRINQLRELMLRCRHRDVTYWGSGQPVVSISFDDVPSESLLYGVPILDHYGCKATFYTCGKFLTKKTKGYLNVDELEALAVQGHEIGCHTFSHLSARDSKRIVYREDLLRGLNAVRQYWQDCDLTFSYPFGHLTYAAKKLVRENFVAGRTTFRGVNSRAIQLPMLRANAIYSPISMPFFDDLLRRVVKQNGWMILYTHDVSPNPTRYGTSVDDFERIIVKCLDAGLQVRTVREAVQHGARL